MKSKFKLLILAAAIALPTLAPAAITPAPKPKPPLQTLKKYTERAITQYYLNAIGRGDIIKQLKENTALMTNRKSSLGNYDPNALCRYSSEKLKEYFNNPVKIVPRYDMQLSNCDLTRFDMRKVRLFRPDLRGADLSYSNLTGATMQDAKFFRTGMHQVVMDGLDMSRALMLSTVVENSSTKGLKMSKSTVLGALFNNNNGAINLNNSKINNSIFNASLLVTEVKGVIKAVSNFNNAAIMWSVYQNVRLGETTFGGAKLVTEDFNKSTQNVDRIFAASTIADVRVNGKDI